LLLNEYQALCDDIELDVLTHCHSTKRYFHGHPVSFEALVTFTNRPIFLRQNVRYEALSGRSGP
jgi:hypothetical protein